MIGDRCRRRKGISLAILAAVVLAGAGGVEAQTAGLLHGGAELDGYGHILAFGGLTLNQSRLPVWNWDIARATAVREDGSGGWTLDGWGAIHSWGNAPQITSPAVWPGWDIARDMVMVSSSGGVVDGAQGYLLDGFGGVHPWGGAPRLSGFPYTPGRDLARGLAIHLSAGGQPDGGWTLDKDGTIQAFGQAPPLLLSLPHENLHLKLHLSGAGGYVVAKWGIVTTFGPGVSPYWNGYADQGATDIIRDIQLLDPTNPTPQPEPSSTAATARYQASLRPHGGAVLDGWGGIHPFGGLQLDTARAPYWQGWDIARSMVVRADGSGGWTLDGWGDIYAWGGAPPIATPAWWQGWDIARAIVVTSRGPDGLLDGRQGYLLDGWGGLHPWGGAPSLATNDAFYGFDIARGLEIHYDSGGTPDGAWIVDRFGVVHAVGAAPSLAAVSPYPKMPLYRAFHASGAGYYLVGSYGVLVPSGNVGAVYWDGYVDWGSWDITRDIAVVNPVNPDGPQQQPGTNAAWTAFVSSLGGSYGVWAPLYRQLRPLDCESAALQMSLAARGTYVSQDWLVNAAGADRRPAVKDRYGNILQWGNPYRTFVGNVDGSQWNATGYGIYWPPLAAITGQLGHSSMAGENWSPSDLYAMVAAGYPAEVWVPFQLAAASTRYWTAWDGSVIPYIRNEHTMTLVGVDFGHGSVTLNDPEYGYHTISMGFFQQEWSYLHNMTLVVS